MFESGAAFATRWLALKKEVDAARRRISLQSSATDEGREYVADENVHRQVTHAMRMASCADKERSVWKHALAGRCWQRVVGMIEWWDSIEEPARKGTLHSLMISHVAERVTSMVILANCAFTGYVSDWGSKHIGETMAGPIQTIDTIFLSYYIMELFLKLKVHGLYFFVNHDYRWNVFDFCIILLSTCDVVLTRLLSMDQSGVNIGFVRIVRIMRLAKIFRTLRVMKVFKELATIMQSFTSCFYSLFWCFVMMLFIFYVFSLVLLQGMIAYVEEHAGDMIDEERDLVQHYFGSLARAMLSLYMSVTGGDDWGTCFWLLYRAGGLYAMMFLFFTFFFMFAVLNILTGVFVDKTISAAKPDAEARILEQERQTTFESETLMNLFRAMERDDEGFVTFEEFQHYLTHDFILDYLSSIGLEVRDPRTLFDMLSTFGCRARQRISLEMLVEGCLALRGSASTLDMRKQMSETEGIRKHLTMLEWKLAEAFERLEAQVVNAGMSCVSRQGSEWEAKACEFEESNGCQVFRQQRAVSAYELGPGPVSKRLQDKQSEGKWPSTRDADVVGLESAEQAPRDDEAPVTLDGKATTILESLREELLDTIAPRLVCSIGAMLEQMLASRSSLHRADGQGADHRQREAFGAASVRQTSPRESHVDAFTFRPRPSPAFELAFVDGPEVADDSVCTEAASMQMVDPCDTTLPLPGQEGRKQLLDLFRMSGPATVPGRQIHANANGTVGTRPTDTMRVEQ